MNKVSKVTVGLLVTASKVLAVKADPKQTVVFLQSLGFVNPVVKASSNNRISVKFDSYDEKHLKAVLGDFQLTPKGWKKWAFGDLGYIFVKKNAVVLRPLTNKIPTVKGEGDKARVVPQSGTQVVDPGTGKTKTAPTTPIKPRRLAPADKKTTDESPTEQSVEQEADEPQRKIIQGKVYTVKGSQGEYSALAVCLAREKDQSWAMLKTDQLDPAKSLFNLVPASRIEEFSGSDEDKKTLTSPEALKKANKIRTAYSQSALPKLVARRK